MPLRPLVKSTALGLEYKTGVTDCLHGSIIMKISLTKINISFDQLKFSS